MTITDQADDHRPAAEVPALDVLPDPGARGSPRGSRSTATSRAPGSSCHAAPCRRGMPETFVGWPAVIACDDLLLRRRLALVEADVAAEAQHRDPVGDLEDVVQVVRDQDHGDPLLGQALDEREHLLGLRDAERGGRLVEDHELASSTSPRARPRPTGAGRRRASRPAAGSSGSSSRASLFSVSAVFCSITGSLSRWKRSCASRPRYMFWTTSRLSQSARSW